jgi:hypothetical protein
VGKIQAGKAAIVMDCEGEATTGEFLASDFSRESQLSPLLGRKLPCLCTQSIFPNSIHSNDLPRFDTRHPKVNCLPSQLVRGVFGSRDMAILVVLEEFARSEVDIPRRLR